MCCHWYQAGAIDVLLRDRSIADRDGGGPLRQALRNAAIDADVATVEPNLEDVFVAATRGDDASVRAA